MTKTNDELDAVLESIEWLDDDGGAFVSNDGAVFRFAMLKSLAADYRRLKAEVIETCPECGFNLHFDGEMDVCYRCLSDEWRHLNEQTTQRWMVEKNENERLKAERDAAVRAVEHYAENCDDCGHLIDNHDAECTICECTGVKSIAREALAETAAIRAEWDDLERQRDEWIERHGELMKLEKEMLRIGQDQANNFQRFYDLIGMGTEETTVDDVIAFWDKREAERDEALRVLSALVEAVKASDEDSKGVFTVAAVHGFPYRGRQHGDALAAASSVLEGKDEAN